MKPLTKQEFMSKVINDLYEKKRKKKLDEAEVHSILNTQRVMESRRKYK